MILRQLLEQAASAGQGLDSEAKAMLRLLLSNRADNKDREISSLLLKRLVENYARLERELKKKQERIMEDLRAAGEIQLALLPKFIPESRRVAAAWRFLPCENVGGDILNVFSPSPGLFCFYVLDVSGHGVPSAMIAVSAMQALHPGGACCEIPGDENENRLSPKKVLTALDREFPFERFDKHFTIVFGALEEDSGTFRYSSAGHPPPLLLKKNGETLFLEGSGPVIGFGDMLPFPEMKTKLGPGDRVVMYTDGVIEHRDQNRMFFGQDRLVERVRTDAAGPLETMLDNLLRDLNDFGGGEPPRDDVTLLAFEYRKT